MRGSSLRMTTPDNVMAGLDPAILLSICSIVIPANASDPAALSGHLIESAGRDHRVKPGDGFGCPTWPNGFDIAPEWLRRAALKELHSDAAA
jgi:hypothetical protein